MTSPWTDEVTAKLKRLYAEGRSYGQIKAEPRATPSAGKSIVSAWRSATSRLSRRRGSRPTGSASLPTSPLLSVLSACRSSRRRQPRMPSETVEAEAAR
jgi:hypothetical protein